MTIKKQDQIIQVTFLVPIMEDKTIGNGKLHSKKKWESLKTKLVTDYFTGWTMAQIPLLGVWIDDSGNIIEDVSQKFYVDIKRKDLFFTRAFIKKMAKVFCQKCIRFEHEGIVEYIG